MAYTKYSLTPADNNAAPPNGAPEGMLPSAVNDTMRDMMSQIRDVGDGIRGGTYTMTAPVITGGSITGVALSGNTLTNPVITGGSINNTTVGATTRSTGAFTTLASNGATTFTAGTASTSTTTGTAVITGGLGVSGRINAANFDGIVGANTAAAGNFTTLGATGVATFSAGTVSAPAITTTGDTNTGIFFPAADTIAFTEGGVEAMRIDSAGNVGVGLTPTASGYGRYEQIGHASETLLGLHAQAINTNDQRTYFVNNAAPTASAGSFTYYKSSANATAYQQTAGAHIWQTAATGTAGNAITFAESMRITSAGNVGIGTSSPDKLLSIANNIRFDGSGNILGKADNTGSLNMYGGGDYNAGAGIILQGTSSGTPNVITFTRGAFTESSRFDSTGALLIGTTSNPDTAAFIKLVVSGGDAIFRQNIGLATGQSILFNQYYKPATTSIIALGNGYVGNIYLDNSNGNLGFNTSTASQTAGANTNSASTVRMTINTSGSVALQGAVTNATGTGITFPATQSASSNANTLDDYEEGTWTPVVGGTATYTLQRGTYTKIGNLVTIRCVLKILLLGTGSGTTISGLPFAAGAITDTVASGALAYFENLPSNVVYIAASVPSNTSTVNFSTLASAGATLTPAATVLASTTRVDFSLTYFAA
jgi:hypothetical protein